MVRRIAAADHRPGSKIGTMHFFAALARLSSSVARGRANLIARSRYDAS